MNADGEQNVWSGTPSQVVNLGAFIGWGLLIWLVFPLFILFWKWLEVRSIRYELTTERLRTRHGVLNKQTDELELYRVRDFKLVEPLLLRLFSLANVVIETSDRSNPVLTVRAIAGGEWLREQLRRHVEACRQRKNVREIDVE